MFLSTVFRGMLRRRSRVHLAAGGIAHFLLMNDQVFADLDVREDIDGSRSGITVQSVFPLIGSRFW